MVKVSEEPIRIVSIEIENVKRVKLAKITPSKDVQIISGDNGAGKTSVMNSVWWLITGAKNIQDVPVRKGAKTATIRGLLGSGEEVEFIVTRHFDEERTPPSWVTVTNGEGLTPPGGPQAILEALYDWRTFDPLDFARKKAKEQLEQLLQICEVGIDLDQLKMEHDTDFQKRTVVNRDAKAYRAQAAGIAIPIGLPAEPISEDDLVTELQRAGDHNAEIERKKSRREAAAREIETLRQDAARLNARIIELQQEKEGIEQKALDLSKKLESAELLPEPIDTTEIRSRLTAAKETNAGIALRTKHGEFVAKAEALEAASKTLTEQMAARESSKAASLAEAKMPIPDLAFGDGCVLYKGLPFDQASDLEQLEVSLAIVMAAKPKLRVALIRQGALIGTKGMEIIERMAAERGFQIWIEKMDDSGKVGVYFEDGEIKAVNP